MVGSTNNLSVAPCGKRSMAAPSARVGTIAFVKWSGVASTRIVSARGAGEDAHRDRNAARKIRVTFNLGALSSGLFRGPAKFVERILRAGFVGGIELHRFRQGGARFRDALHFREGEAKTI